MKQKRLLTINVDSFRFNRLSPWFIGQTTKKKQDKLEFVGKKEAEKCGKDQDVAIRVPQ